MVCKRDNYAAVADECDGGGEGTIASEHDGDGATAIERDDRAAVAS